MVLDGVSSMSTMQGCKRVLTEVNFLESDENFDKSPEKHKISLPAGKWRLLENVGRKLGFTKKSDSQSVSFGDLFSFLSSSAHLQQVSELQRQKCDEVHKRARLTEEIEALRKENRELKGLRQSGPGMRCFANFDWFSFPIFLQKDLLL